MSLFDDTPETTTFPIAAPLSSRMRPQTLDEFVGQQDILGPGKMLRAAIERDELSSAIFYGPAGCGKSTLAHIIARRTRARYETFSAVPSGIAEVRKVMEQARVRLTGNGQRTVLFIDEIHRFNRAQQDAFLPFVEAGTIILLGATTENPYFSVNSPLLSRARVFQFVPLAADDLRQIIHRALSDEERGLGRTPAQLEPDAMEHLIVHTNGDARRALNALEMAVVHVAGLQLADSPREEDRLRISLQHVADSLQRRALAYDAHGDMHYDTVSAFIKSLRGSDADAALYWLAKMVKAGEDPRLIARRMVILASEDVGNADPLALVVATATAHAVEYVGMPEARLNLAQAATYLALAPKSNASYVGLQRALEDVERRPAASIPKHLRDASYRGAAQLGHGEGYRYPHDAPAHFVVQEYMPPGVKSGPYYEPIDIGQEKKLKERMATLQRIANSGVRGEP